MNSDEVTRALALIESAYGSKMQASQRNLELVIEVWMIALEDVPWTPYGELALSWWIRNEAWPPAPADIRERAKRLMRDEKREREDAATLARYKNWHPNSIGGGDRGGLRQLVASSAGGDAREPGDHGTGR